MTVDLEELFGTRQQYFAIWPGSPEFEAWSEYYEACGGLPWAFTRGVAVTVPTQWPPGASLPPRPPTKLRLVKC
jgi:hypothetical protein